MKAERFVGLGLVLLAFLGVSIAFNLAVPPYEGFDEPNHVQYAEYVVATGGPPVVPSDEDTEAAQPPAYYYLQALLLKVSPTGPPPVLVFRAPPDPPLEIFHHPAIDSCLFCKGELTIHLMRFLSTLLAIGTIVAAFLLGWLLFPDRPGMAIAIAGATALEPQFAYVNSIVNNDSLAFMTAAVVLLGCCGIAVSVKERSRIQFAGITGFALGMAFLTKEYAFTLLPLPLLAVGLASVPVKRRLLYTVVVASVSTLICGVWLVRNAVVYGQPWPFQAELANIRRLLPETAWNGPVPASYFSDVFPSEFFESFWYSGGWGQLRLPLRWYFVIGAMVVLLTIGFGCAVVQWRGRWPQRKAVPILLAAILLDIVGAIYSNLAVHQPQGRYLLPAMPAVAVVLVVGWEWWLPSKTARSMPIVVPVVLLSLTTYALAFVTRFAYFG